MKFSVCKVVSTNFWRFWEAHLQSYFHKLLRVLRAQFGVVLFIDVTTEPKLGIIILFDKFATMTCCSIPNLRMFCVVLGLEAAILEWVGLYRYADASPSARFAIWAVRQSLMLSTSRNSQCTDLNYMGGSGPCWSVKQITGAVLIQRVRTSSYIATMYQGGAGNPIICKLQGPTLYTIHSIKCVCPYMWIVFHYRQSAVV